MASKKKTILVSGASGIVGYGILKSLRQSKENYKLIGITIHEKSVATAFSDIFEKAPLTSDDNYISWLVDITDKYKVDMLIPSIEADVFAWNKHRKIIGEKSSFVLLNNPDLIDLCSDKWIFYQELKNNEPIYAIQTSVEYNSEKHKFPFLLKPRRGFASKGIVIVEDEGTFALYKNHIGEKLMIQPIVGSAEEEYTTSAFFDTNSNLCSYIILKRKLSSQGYTEIAQTEEVESMEGALSRLAKIFKPIGPTNFQFRISDGQLKLLEINPRISSATSIRSAFGYNESVMSVDYFLNKKRPFQSTFKTGYAVRYTEDMIYYDSSNL